MEGMSLSLEDKDLDNRSGDWPGFVAPRDAGSEGGRALPRNVKCYSVLTATQCYDRQKACLSSQSQQRVCESQQADGANRQDYQVLLFISIPLANALQAPLKLFTGASSLSFE